LRDGGCNSSEILLNFAAAVARPSGGETRHLAKPLPRCAKAADRAAENLYSEN